MPNCQTSRAYFWRSGHTLPVRLVEGIKVACYANDNTADYDEDEDGNDDGRTNKDAYEDGEDGGGLGMDLTDR